MPRILGWVEPLRDAHGRDDHRPAGLGHRPLQLPLSVLHAGRGDALARPRPAAQLRGDHAAGRGARRARVTDVRLTGGEPLARREFPRLVSMLRAIEGIGDLSMTTNGYLLERDAAALVDAGIDRVNVSIDSLARDRFHEITRRDALPQVLRGLEAIAAYERVRPIKVNAVAMRDFTEREALAFAELARSTDYQVRFIEFMPLDGDRAWTPDQVLTGDELRALIDARPPARAAAPRAPRHRPRLPLRATAAARSASSTRSPSRSAPTATASA